MTGAGGFQMVGPDLYFIQTRDTASGRVEVHNATANSGYQSASLHSTTWIPTDAASNGHFQMVGADLYFIQTRDTASGRVEVHNATAGSGYQSASVHSSTWLPAERPG